MLLMVLTQQCRLKATSQQAPVEQSFRFSRSDIVSMYVVLVNICRRLLNKRYISS